MDDSVPSIEVTSMASAAERMFPTLTAQQMERAAAHAVIRPVQGDEVLVESGTPNTRFFIVKNGRLHIVRPPEMGEQLVATLGPGQFTGETSMLAGQPAMVRILVLETAELIQLERDQLLDLVQTDSELSD